MGKNSKYSSKYHSKYNYNYEPEKESYYNHSCFSLEIKKSQIKDAGKGVFTLDFIPNETMIDVYTGNRYPYPMSFYFISICDSYGIDAGSFPRCYMAMINDSFGSLFKDNCEFRIKDDNVYVYSLRDIYPEEELFVSYGDEYWK